MDVKVGIIMGSDSDLLVMSKAAERLEELKVAYELTIVSAHRTPDRLCLKDYAEGLNQTVLKKAEKLEGVKYEEYLKQM